LDNKGFEAVGSPNEPSPDFVSDSQEYQQVGGVRSSDRKRPVRQKPADPAVAANEAA
jgi:hypothetical protein